MTRRSPSYEARLVKYAQRGWEIWYPALRRGALDESVSFGVWPLLICMSYYLLCASFTRVTSQLCQLALHVWLFSKGYWRTGRTTTIFSTPRNPSGRWPLGWRSRELATAMSMIEITRILKSRTDYIGMQKECWSTQKKSWVFLSIRSHSVCLMQI